LHELLVEQLTNPVQFMQAVAEAEADVDMFIEVGPGTVVTNLTKSMTQVPVVSLDMAGPSMSDLSKALGAAYALGSPIKLNQLWEGRFTRSFDFKRQPKFFVNPCELERIVEPRTSPSSLIPRKPERARNQAAAPANRDVTYDGADALSIIRNLIARRTELPPETITDSARFLRDLHLNSIVVGEIVANAAHALRVTPPAQVLGFADATIGELATRLEESRKSESARPFHDAVPAGIEDWCRAFVVKWRPALLGSTKPDGRRCGAWTFFGPDDHPWLQLLSRTLLPGEGVLVLMADGSTEDQVGELLAAARHAVSSLSQETHFVVLGPVAIVGAFARTINLENPNILTRVVEVPSDLDVVSCLLAELYETRPHVEARYDSDGIRYEPSFELLKMGDEERIPVHRGETVLVTGGAKGIAAECSYALAQNSGAKLVLLGRSPESDAAVVSHLGRLKTIGVQAIYIQADVTRADQVKGAIDSVEKIYGPITGIIHGAGANEPARFDQLDDAQIQATLAPKIRGFHNLIESVDTSRLRLFVSFGSVIGRVGLAGEAHYALANALLSALTDDFSRLHPHCRCLAFESSAWSGMGMAERLGKLAELRDAGVSPISPGEGVAWFSTLVAQNLPANTVVLSGRLGANPPIPIESSALPLRRFIEHPRVHYPGIELISDCELTTVSDPYLLDHVFHGQPLLPGVIGIEAMVQVATALYGEEEIPVVEDLHFEHPIVIDPANRVTLRIAALRRDDQRIDVVIRSSQTSFQLDHFRCSCVFRNEPTGEDRSSLSNDSPPILLDPRGELYGSLLFQGPRFQRLKRYQRLSAQLSCAEIDCAPATSWFTAYLPGKLILGDPGSRDAAIHSIQACVPEDLLLPLGVDRIEFGNLDSTEQIVADASERWHEGNTYCYDMEVRALDGTLRERWCGLRLRKVDDAKPVEWPDPLMGVILERRLRKVEPGSHFVAAFERDKAAGRHSRTQRALEHALNAPCPVRWRIDGRPEVDGPLVVSAAHNGGLTLAVAAPDVVACDLESIEQRPAETWRNMLGPERWMLARLISNQAQEDIDTSATRVWTAMESLAKAQAARSGPLVLLSCSVDRDRVVSLSTPDLAIATSVLRFRDHPAPLAVAVLTRTKVCANMSIGTESVLKRQIS
jgi:enediyne polyketide synthase